MIIQPVHSPAAPAGLPTTAMAWQAVQWAGVGDARTRVGRSGSRSLATLAVSLVVACGPVVLVWLIIAIFGFGQT